MPCFDIGLPRVLFAPFVVAGLMGCSGATADVASDSPEQTASPTETMAYTLPGFDETLIVADGAGGMTIVRVGPHSSRTKVTGAPTGLPVAGRSAGGLFHVLTDDGVLATIDPASAKVVRTTKTKIRGGADLEVESDQVAYVTSEADGKLRKIDPGTGRAVATLDLGGGSGGAKVTLRNVLRLGDRLLVEVHRTGAADAAMRGAVAVVAVKDMTLVKLVELVVPDPRIPGKTVDGLNPGGPMVLDRAHGRVFVTAKGARPSNTGMLLRHDARPRPLVVPRVVGVPGTGRHRRRRRGRRRVSHQHAGRVDAPLPLPLRRARRAAGGAGRHARRCVRGGHRASHERVAQPPRAPRHVPGGVLPRRRRHLLCRHFADRRRTSPPGERAGACAGVRSFQMISARGV